RGPGANRRFVPRHNRASTRTRFTHPTIELKQPRRPHMSTLVTRTAPAIKAQAVMPNGMIESFDLEKYRGKHVILYFYPLAFTFVCPTEIIAFDKKIEEFKARGAEVIGVSVDSVHALSAWRNTPV